MKDIVNELIGNGYEAYIVGGYVRDYLIGIPSNDIDICTNAPINKIMKIFKGRGQAFKEYFSYHIKDDNYIYTITTYRKENKYKKNKPIDIEVASDLYTDLQRRDFTINTFAIDHNGKLIDLLNAKRDLNSKIIRVVGDTDKKLTEDKTRILRAIRFSCTLDFELDNEILNFIKSKKICLLNEVPKEYKRKELDKIFDSSNRFFYLLKRFDISKYFNIKFDNIIPTYNKYGIWSQIETDLPFSNKELEIISNIKKIVNNKDIYLIDLKNYSNEVLYNAANLLKNEKKLKMLIDILKLHSIIDIDIKISEFFKYVNVQNIKSVYKLVEKNILEGYLQNNEGEIIEFLKEL